MPKKAVSSKVSYKTDKKLEEISDKKGISKSELLNRYIRQSIEIERGKKEITRVETDGSGEVQETLDQAQQTLQLQSEKLDEQKRAQKYLSLSLSLAIFWLGAHIIFVVPSLVSIGTGTVLIAVLVYSYYRYLWE
jgi:hypothetical protein